MSKQKLRRAHVSTTTTPPDASATTGLLTAELVVDRAIDLINAEGFEAITMRRLADQCGVGPMAFYRYFSTKEELLGAVADRFLSEVKLPPAGSQAWEEEVANLFRRIRDVLVAHPALAQIMANQPVDGPAAYRYAEIALSAFMRAGLDGDRATAAFDSLGSFVIGFAQRDAARSGKSKLVAHRLAEVLHLPVDDYPTVHALAGGLVKYNSDFRFEAGLDLLIRGISAQLK